MRPCLWRSAASRLARWPRYHARLFTTHTHDEVHVSCGSAGSVSIDLINLEYHPASSPLFIYLPPLPPHPDEAIPLPDVLQPWPIAIIRYRWSNLISSDESVSSGSAAESLRWPTPVHDTGFAYSWLQDALAPSGVNRRDIYVLGTHLGSSLAVSLGLTEAHSHSKFGVRGVVAYNGIYNWTMFLPDHRINKVTTGKRKKESSQPPPRSPEGSHISNLQQRLPDLFHTPAQMFDTFASPSLLFHGSGVLIPKSFTLSTSEAFALDSLLDPESAPPPAKTPRRSHLIFPPRKSTLKIPPTLLLHSTANLLTPKLSRRSTMKGNSFETQAEELAEMMRKSVDKVELKMRSQWDDEMDGLEEEAERRVRVVDVGEEREGFEMGGEAEEVLEEWLDQNLC